MWLWKSNKKLCYLNRQSKRKSHKYDVNIQMYFLVQYFLRQRLHQRQMWKQRIQRVLPKVPRYNVNTASFNFDISWVYSPKELLNVIMHVFLIVDVKLAVPFQFESLIALLLCAISCIMVIIPINRTATQYFIAVIIIPVAGNIFYLIKDNFIVCKYFPLLDG